MFVVAREEGARGLLLMVEAGPALNASISIAANVLLVQSQTKLDSALSGGLRLLPGFCVSCAILCCDVFVSIALFFVLLPCAEHDYSTPNSMYGFGACSMVALDFVHRATTYTLPMATSACFVKLNYGQLHPPLLCLFSAHLRLDPSLQCVGILGRL